MAADDGLTTIRYAPRRAFRPFHDRTERFAAIVAHRRAGKTVAVVNDLIRDALLCDKPNPRTAYIAPFYTQAKDVAWGYAKEFSSAIPGVQFNESELRVDYPNGGRLRLYGADNYDRMRGIYLDAVGLDEPADFPPDAWPTVIRPALADRRGKATFMGTPKGRNDFFAIWQNAAASPDWFHLMLRASESGLLHPEELAAARLEMGENRYAQEFECSFDAAILGAYYAELIADAETEGRVGDWPLDPDQPVHTAWDLGIGDSTAIWLWQAAPDGLRVIDRIEDHGKSLPFYVAELAAKGHRYGTDFVPHDAKVRELGTGRSRLETLVALGRKPQLVAQHSIEDGINALRQMFPRTWWHAPKCREGLEALRQYRTEYDEKLKAFRNKPRHDWTSHTADAARYMALAYREMRAARPAPKPALKPGQVYLPGPPEPRKATRIRL